MGKRGRPRKEVDLETKTNSLTEVVTSLGLTADMSQTMPLLWNNRYNAITLNRSALTDLYMEHGVVQTLIDQPVDDAFRGRPEITTNELSAAEIDLVWKYCIEHNIIREYGQSIKWGRLFGGGGLIINVNQDPLKPFTFDAIKKNTPMEFYPVDCWELSFTLSPDVLNQYKQDQIEIPFQYYGQRIHRSNVLQFKGKECPSMLRGQFRGWGMSEIERAVRSLNMYFKNQNVVYELLDEAKIDVFQISGFNSALLSPQGMRKVTNHLQLVQATKNYNSAVAIDKEDQFHQKTMSFSGLAEIARESRMGVACDLKMPLTKLFGMTSQGFSDGEDAIENYNSMIETEIRSKTMDGYLFLLKCVCKKLFGFIPSDLSFEWPSLRITKEKDMEELRSWKMNQILAVQQSGIITSEFAVDLINSERIFKLQLEKSEATSLQEFAKAIGDEADGQLTRTPSGQYLRV